MIGFAAGAVAAVFAAVAVAAVFAEGAVVVDWVHRLSLVAHYYFQALILHQDLLESLQAQRVRVSIDLMLSLIHI